MTQPCPGEGRGAGGTRRWDQGERLSWRQLTAVVVVVVAVQRGAAVFRHEEGRQVAGKEAVLV